MFLSKQTVSATIKLSSPATHEFWEIPVLYEDEHLLALDKPSGLLTSPDRTEPDRPSLTKLLHAGIERGAPWATEGGRTYLMPAHRLDAETSGVIAAGQEQAGARRAGEPVQRGEARQTGTWRSCRARPRRTGSRWKPSWRLTRCGSASCAWIRSTANVP